MPELWRVTCADSEGAGTGVGTLPPHPTHENHKAIGLLSNTGPEPLENHKATITKPAFNVGPSSACERNTITLPITHAQIRKVFSEGIEWTIGPPLTKLSRSVRMSYRQYVWTLWKQVPNCLDRKGIRSSLVRVCLLASENIGSSGADPGLLERGFALLILSHFS